MTGTDRVNSVAPVPRDTASPDECLRLVASFRAVACSETRARIVALVRDEAQRTGAGADASRPVGLR